MLSLHHVALSVTSLEKSEPFYAALGFERVLRWQADDASLEIVQMKHGEMLLELFCYAEPKAAPHSMQALDSDLKRIGTKHFGLKTDDIAATRKHLIEQGLCDEHTTITHGRTGIDYLFLRDPDGIFVEIVQDDRSL